MRAPTFVPAHASAGLAARRARQIGVAFLVLAAMPYRTTAAQGDDRRWQVSGEAGGIIGGQWLKGDNAPSITAGAGAELSLRAVRGLRARVDGGAAVRVSAQSLQLKENDASWSGPTITAGSLIAISSIAVARSETWRSALDAGAGVMFLSGARSIYPFSTASRLAPTLEGGVSFRHEVDAGVRAKRSLIGQTGFFARYEITRIDPGAAPVGGGGAVGITGWVGRVALGLRVER